MSYRVVWFKRDLCVQHYWPFFRSRAPQKRRIPQVMLAGSLSMKMRKKTDLPQMVYAACGLPFV